MGRWQHRLPESVLELFGNGSGPGAGGLIRAPLRFTASRLAVSCEGGSLATCSSSGLLRWSSLDGSPARPTDMAMLSARVSYGHMEVASSRWRESRCEAAPCWTRVNRIRADSPSGARRLPYWSRGAGLGRHLSLIVCPWLFDQGSIVSRATHRELLAPGRGSAASVASA